MQSIKGWALDVAMNTSKNIPHLRTCDTYTLTTHLRRRTRTRNNRTIEDLYPLPTVPPLVSLAPCNVIVSILRAD